MWGLGSGLRRVAPLSLRQTGGRTLLEPQLVSLSGLNEAPWRSD